jgi:hypothetical protein
VEFTLLCFDQVAPVKLLQSAAWLPVTKVPAMLCRVGWHREPGDRVFERIFDPRVIIWRACCQRGTGHFRAGIVSGSEQYNCDKNGNGDRHEIKISFHIVIINLDLSKYSVIKPEDIQFSRLQMSD